MIGKLKALVVSLRETLIYVMCSWDNDISVVRRQKIILYYSRYAVLDLWLLICSIFHPHNLNNFLQ